MTHRRESEFSFMTDTTEVSIQSTSLQHLEFEDGTVPMVKKTGGSGRMSPVRARTMKEFEQQIAELQKENFSLKLRIYFLEERMKKEFDGGGEDVYKINIELQVEVESLKQDLVKKQDLLKQASNALDSITAQHQVELQQACQSAVEEVRQQMRGDVSVAEQTISDLRTQLHDTDQLVQKLRNDVEESNKKLQELFIVNDMLDSRCRTLESAKHQLEMRLEAAMDSSSSDSEQDSRKVNVNETILQEKDKLIEQLRCGLRAKDVIIEQLEEEKTELVNETAQQFEDRINELNEKLRALEANVEAKPLIIQSGNESGLGDSGRIASQSLSNSSNSSTSTSMDLEKNQDEMSLKQQVMAAKDSLEENESLKNSLREMEDEADQLKRKLAELESVVDNLRQELNAAGMSATEKEGSLKELKATLEEERLRNAEKLASVNAEFKALQDATGRQAEVHGRTIEQLLEILKQRDVNIHQYLTVTHQDASVSPTRGTDISEVKQAHVNTGGSLDCQTISRVTVTDAINQTSTESEIKSLHDHHSSEVKRLTEEIIALRSRFDEVDRKKQLMSSESSDGSSRNSVPVSTEITVESSILTSDASVSSPPMPRTVDDLINLSYELPGSRHSSVTGVAGEKLQESILLETSLQSSSDPLNRLTSQAATVAKDIVDNNCPADETLSTDFDKQFSAELRESSGSQTVETSYKTINGVRDVESVVDVVDDRRQTSADCVVSGEMNSVNRDSVATVARGQHDAADRPFSHVGDQNVMLLQQLHCVMSELRDAVETVKKDASIKFVQLSCKQVDKILERLSNMESECGNGTPNQSNYVLNKDCQFYGLTKGSFSTDPSDLSQVESFDEPCKSLTKNSPDFQRTSPRVVETSRIANAAIDGVEFRCSDSSLSNDRVSVSHSEPQALQSKLADQEQRLPAMTSRRQNVQVNTSSVIEDTVGANAESEIAFAKIGRNVDSENDSLPDLSSAHQLSRSVGSLRNCSERKLDSTSEAERQLKHHVSQLSKEINELSGRLRQADNTIVLLKRHIQLNTLPDGSSSPGLNPDLIVALAHEVERLNSELDAYRSLPVGAAVVMDSKEASSSDQNGVTSNVPVRKRSGIPVRTTAVQRVLKTLSQSVDKLQLEGATDRHDDEQATSEGSSSDRNVFTADGIHGDVTKSFETGSFPQGSNVKDLKSALGGSQDREAVAAQRETSFHNGLDAHDDSILQSCDVSRLIHQTTGASVPQTPINTISVNNRRAFQELQAEVERLRRRLELTELENSRLLEMSRRESMSALSFIGNCDQKPTDAIDVSSDTESGQVTLSAGFLKNLIEAHKRDHTHLQRRLAESHDACRMLRDRMEELIGFLEEMLVSTPPQKTAAERRAHVSACLNETRSLLADLSMTMADHGDLTLTEGMSHQQLELSSVLDLDASLQSQGTSAKLLHEQVQVEAQHLHDEQRKLALVRDEMQATIHLLTEKLTAADSELTLTRSRNSELATELEQLKQDLAQQENGMASMLQTLKSRESTIAEIEFKLAETTENVLKLKLKNEELIRVKREMESVLVEQEKNVTECEERISRVTKERADERNALHRTLSDHVTTIAALKREREEQLLKINGLETELVIMRNQLSHDKPERLSKTKEGADDRDAVISKLKALVRENKSTAERLREELHKMNDEAVDKNRTINRLRQSCKELSVRCNELETALCHSGGDVGSPWTRQGGSVADISDFSNCRRSISDWTETPFSTRSFPVPLSNESSAKRVDDSADEVGNRQMTVDFETWNMQYRTDLQSAVVSSAGCGSSQPVGVPGENDDRCVLSRRSDDLSMSSGVDEISEGGISSTIRSAGILQLQLHACSEIEKIVRTASRACAQIQTIDPTAGQGDGSTNGRETPAEAPWRQLLNQLEDSLRKNEAIQLRLKSGLDVAAADQGGPSRSASQYSVNNPDAINDTDLLHDQRLSNQQLVSLELELSSMRQRLEESTALNHALRLELEMNSRLLDEDKENFKDQAAVGSDNNSDLRGILVEIRNLRCQLERSVASNELLHHKLDQYAVKRLSLDASTNHVNDINDVSAGSENKGSSDTSSSLMRVVVISESSLEMLRGETDKISTLLGKLQTAMEDVKTWTAAGGNDVSVSIRQLAAQLSHCHREQHRLVLTFGHKSVSVDSSEASAAIRAENQSLKHQLNELKQKYIRLKQAMKTAQERLDANSHKKEEIVLSRKGWRNDEAIIEQINKTRQVLAQSSRNLERHQHLGATADVGRDS